MWLAILAFIINIVVVSMCKKPFFNLAIPLPCKGHVMLGDLQYTFARILSFSFWVIRTFPWMIEIFDISPYHFYKIIEVFIKAEDGLSRDVVKHLNHVS